MNDARDWFIMLFVACTWVAATVFLFMHPSGLNYTTWAGYGATAGGIFHWLMVHDQKVPDARVNN